MNLDEMKSLWQSHGSGAGGTHPSEDLISRVRRDAEKLDRKIRRRDTLEILVAGLVSVLILPLVTSPAWITRAGALLMIAGCVLVVVRLSRARIRYPRPDPAAPLTEALRAARERIDAQIRLLESVFWWYLAPLCGGAVLVFAGNAGSSVSILIYALVVCIVALAIYRLNVYAVRRELRPRRDALEQLLASLREE